MIGGNRVPLKDWPTRQLIAVGISIGFISVSGFILTLRLVWQAWNQGERGVALVALLVAAFFAIWVGVFAGFVGVLHGRWRPPKSH